MLDEAVSACAVGILSVPEVNGLLDEKPTNVELILTGRNASQELIDRADLVTEMKMVKHYFYKGVKAREGLDY